MQSLLKFITCGSVDDGKSTLIGHMLYDAKLLFADQQRTLELDSRLGSRNGEIDYSLLLDGLMAEREQGITIDVAYRYFTTSRRSFIVADTPGHEEYTRNMAVGASFADLAVILVDAYQGVLTQTRRHTRICALMGIRHVVFAVNKMDLIHYDKFEFEKIKKDISQMISEFEFDSIAMIPVSATEGDNVTKQSLNTAWYKGKTLLAYLEEIDVHDKKNTKGFVLPVQRVCRPDHDFRGFQGQVANGEVRIGDEVRILPSDESAKVKNILVTDRQVQEASRGQAVTIQLDREVDVSRGCVICRECELKVGSLFRTTILWMDDSELVEGKNYWLSIGTKTVPAVVMNIKYQINVNDGSHIHTKRLRKNEIAACNISTSDKTVFDLFRGVKDLGCFILIDRVTNMTSACGVIEYALRRDQNISWQNMDINREIRAQQKSQVPKTIWFTGLSGSGKSTLSNALEIRLVSMGKHTMSLDGDNIRMGLNRNLGFAEQDRIENIRRIAEVSRLMNDGGLIVLTSFISPYIRDRAHAKEIIGEENFIEIYVSTPLEECERRDVKGLYKRAKNGEIPNFTGISSPYEPPVLPDIVIDTSQKTLDESIDFIMNELQKLLDS